MNFQVLVISIRMITIFLDASLIELIKKFKSKTIYFWYSIILGKRLLFYGNSAHEVALSCLSVPLLVISNYL